MPKSYGSHRRFLDNSIATERDLVKRKLEYPELYQKQGEKIKGAILPQADWAKKVRGSQILQQKALKLTAGKVGQSSYTKILQERLGIVKRFYKQLEKGQIAPQVDGSYIISLFKHADASTVIYETGHYFVETLVEEALANPDNKQLNNDARILLEYAGTNLEAWRTGDVDSKRPAHEILANAFETLVYIFCIYKNIVIMVIG